VNGDGTFDASGDTRLEHLVTATGTRLREPTISDDGHMVAYTEEALPFDDVPPADLPQVKAIDRGQAGASEPFVPKRLPPPGGGTPLAGGPTSQPDLSGDGRYLSATSLAGNLPGDCRTESPIGINAKAYDPVRCADVVMWDLGRRDTDAVVVSTTPTGGGADRDSGASSLSSTGRFVTFNSSASNLDVEQSAGGDPEIDNDVFARENTPNLVATPERIDFGEVGPGQTVTRVVRFTNQAGTTDEDSWGPLKIETMRIDDPFVIEADGCSDVTLHRGEGCDVRVRYRPLRLGRDTGNVIAGYDGLHWGSKDRPVETLTTPVDLVGDAAGPVFEAPDLLRFGAVRTDATPPERTATIRSSGNRAFEITGLSLEGDDADQFTVDGSDCLGSVAPDTNCDVHVRFSPTSQGDLTAAIRVEHTAPGGPHRIRLEGSGVVGVPVLVATPGRIDFGIKPIGTAAADVTVTIENKGDAPFEVSALDVIGSAADDFAIVGNDCLGPTPLGPSERCAVTVRAIPTASGPRAGRLRVTSSAPGNPHTVDLIVTGAVPTLIFNPGLGPPGSVVTAIGT
jgi:hypothetical protein